jgi:hypothetical protein
MSADTPSCLNWEPAYNITTAPHGKLNLISQFFLNCLSFPILIRQSKLERLFLATIIPVLAVMAQDRQSKWSTS